MRSFAEYLWPFYVVIIYTLRLPAWLLASTLYINVSIDINYLCIYNFKLIFFATFKSFLSQSKCTLQPKHYHIGQVLCPLVPLLAGLRPPPDPLVFLVLAMLAFLLIMFTSGIMSENIAVQVSDSVFSK